MKLGIIHFIKSMTESFDKGSQEGNKPKFESHEQVTAYVENYLKSRGIEVVDKSVYHKSDAESDTVIITGYMQGKAAVFTVDMHFMPGEEQRLEVSCTIDGQLTQAGWEGSDITKDKNYKGADKPVIKLDSSKFYSDYLNKKGQSDFSSPQDVIDKTLIMIDDFLAEYKDKLEETFTKEATLWFVPEYTDALAEEEEKNGKDNPKNYESFNKKVMSKFPEGFFSWDQRP
jgi:hypothetical protein